MKKKFLCVLLIIAAILVLAFVFLLYKDTVLGGLQGIIDGVREEIFGPTDGVYNFTLKIEDEEMGVATTDDPAPLPGERVHLSAIANYGYVFVGWFVDDELVSEEPEYTYTMPRRDVVMVAKFDYREFDVVITSMHPEFNKQFSGKVKYMDTVILEANEIEGTVFVAWFIDGEAVAIDNPSTITVTENVTVYAEYYSYGTVEVYSWPTASAAAVGTPLSEVTLSGGSANALGYFTWADPTEKVYVDGEYIVMFVPFVTTNSENEALIPVPIATKVLSAPSLTIKDGVASWDEVEGATGYEVKVNDEVFELADGEFELKLPEEMNEYYISVEAIGDGETTASSGSSNIEKYVPPKPTVEEVGFGKATSEYGPDGEMVKYGGTTPLTPDDFTVFSEDNVIFEKDYILFDVTVDVAEYLQQSTKKKILDLNKFGVETEFKMLLHAQIKILNPKIYAEVDLDFPFTMRDLAFGIDYTTMVTTSVDVSLNGEFIEGEQRRGTLHLLFMDLIGLEEPLYKWQKATFRLNGTPIAVELALCFDAVGAIAASMYLDNVTVTDYAAGLQLIRDGEAVFVPYFDRSMTTNVTEINLAGELDVSLNCVRLSASLQLVKGDESISIVRLNLDAANIESDLSGSVDVEYDALDPDSGLDAELDVDGHYRFYGQITFEYYLEIKFTFFFLPLDDFGIKVLDGSHILAEWEYIKGGIPKTPYLDEAIHGTTPIFATDGTYEYFVNLGGTLTRTEIGEEYFFADNFAKLDGEAIVDIDDLYIYVLSGNKLRRIGRTAGTERTVLSNVGKVLFSDRNYIYYTTTEAPNEIRRLYRSDIESTEPVVLRLEKDYSILSMYYDRLEEHYVIQAESGSGECFFTLSGSILMQHGENEHKFWRNRVLEDGSVAYYRLDASGNIAECFIRTDTKGVTHASGALSIGITEHGLFTVVENEGAVYGYALGLYPIGMGSGGYLNVAEINDPGVANRVVYKNGSTYFVDINGEEITIYRTDGKDVRIVAVSEFSAPVSSDKLRAEIHGDWLFLYEFDGSCAKVVYTIDVESLETAPYIANGNTQAFDKAAPEDVEFTVGGELEIIGMFLNIFSEAEYEAFIEKVQTVMDKWNELDKFLGENTDFWKSGKVSTDEIMQFLDENKEILRALNIEMLKTEKNGKNLPVIDITVPAEDIADLSYGLHTGYIVTTKGIFEVTVNIIDSRTPSYEGDGVPTFDKGLPFTVKYELLMYDSVYTLPDVPDDGYRVTVKGEKLVIEFYTHYLATLEYGGGSIKLVADGEQIYLPIEVTDSRSPKDSTYFKYFDLTYPKNIVFNFDLFDERYVTKVEGNDIPKMGAFYVSADGNKLTLSGKYLSTLMPGDYTFTLTTVEKTFEVVVRVINTLNPTASCPDEYDLGSADDLKIAYQPNDAAAFEVYINGALLDGAYWRYSYVSGYISIDNTYLQMYMPYGKMNITVRSLMYSGDDLKSHVNTMRTVITDSRAPVIPVKEIVYTIKDGISTSINLYSKLYLNNVESIVADGVTNIPFGVVRRNSAGETDYRNGYISISSKYIVDVLSEGSHTITVTAGGEEFSFNLVVRDERLPAAIGSNTASFNKDFPNSVAYLLRFYGERLISIKFGGENLPDDAYSIVLHSDNGIYHVLTVKKEYLVSLGLDYSQKIEFVLTSNINTFSVYVQCQMDPTSAPGGGSGEGDVEGGSDGTKKPLTPPSYTPVEIATAITVSPDSFIQDKAALTDISFAVSYGTNNGFGSLKYGSKTLVKDTDFVIGADGSITIKASFLDTLSGYGVHTVTLNGSEGRNAKIHITIYDSRDPSLDTVPEYSYDRYLDNSFAFDATLYDSVADKVRVGETVMTSGIKSDAGKIIFSNSLLDAMPLGEVSVFVGFNDSAAEIEVKLTVSDSGLYYAKALADKAAFADDEATFTVPYTLYQGEVDGAESDTLTVASFTNEGVTLAGFASAAYGDHKVVLTANGHTFTLIVDLYDSRKPETAEALYTFDKGDYEYSLNPSVTKNYDLRVQLKLYDNKISGIDMLSNQTITGHQIEYEDYERDGNDYLISYLYLHRLPVGDYTFYISTTDGNVPVKVNVTDSKAPYLLDTDPITYDYAAAGDKTVNMFLYDEDDVSSVSYVDIVTGNVILLENGVDYTFSKDRDDNTVLTLKESLLQDGFYDLCNYKFTVATSTERVLTFGVLIENGPRRPFRITYYNVPITGDDPYFEIPGQTLYEGDYITLTVTPESKYYNFLGFYTEREGGVPFDFSKPVTSDLDIFLRWEPKTYNITLISDGVVVKTLGVKYLSEIPAITDPTKAGYTFIKWSVDEGHEIRFDLEGTPMPHSDITLYAEWRINRYIVVFKDINGVVLKEEELYAYEDATPPDQDMTVEYYTFKGWDKNYTDVLSDLIVYAVYEADKFDIEYDLAGGTNPSSAPKTYTIEGGVKLPTPTKTGHDFLGWYLDEYYMSEVLTEIDEGTLPGLKLYARFEYSTYDVYLNSTVGGVTYEIFGALIDNKLRITYNDEYVIPRVIVPENYFFLGWYTGSGGTGTQYTNYLGEGLNPWTYAGNTTLYAHVVPLVTFSGITVQNGRVDFTANKFDKADMTVKAIELYAYGELIASIAEEDLALGAHFFDELVYETPYEIKVSYAYTLPDVDGERESYASFQIKITDDTYPETLVGNTVFGVGIGKDEFASFSVGDVKITLDGEVIDYATVFKPGNSNSFYANGAYWMYVIDLIANNSYEIEYTYTYTLKDYSGTYTATIKVPFVSGMPIIGIPEPVGTASNTQHELDMDYDYIYYSYSFGVSFTNRYIENNARLTKWYILSGETKIYEQNLGILLSGSTNSWSSGIIPRTTFSSGSTYQVVFEFEYDLQDGQGTRTGYAAQTFTAWTIAERGDPCLVEGTDVLMADGTLKNIEDVKLGDLVLVWNFVTGKYDAAPVTLIHSTVRDQIFWLEFSNGKRLGVSRTHGFFTEEDNRFVTVTADNATEFIGKHFAMENGEGIEFVELIGVEFEEGTREVYTLSTAAYYNHFANGFIAMIPFVELVNMFEFDGAKYDEEAMKADLEKYGKATYEEWADVVTEEQFYIYGGEYMNVLIGKGLMTREELIELLEFYFARTDHT